MEFNDYYQLVKQYHPHTGWYAHKMNESYAKRLEAEHLTAEQTITRLKSDKALGLRYKTAPASHDNAPSNELSVSEDTLNWWGIVLCIPAVIALVKTFT